MKVRFLFCNPTLWWKQPGNALLKWADNVDAGHFAIELETFSGNYVYESVFPCAKKTEKEKWLKHYKVVRTYEWEVPAILQYRVKEWLEYLVGTPYSIAQLLLIAITMAKPLNKLLNWTILNHHKYLICTEVGSRFIEKFMTLWIYESHDKVGLNDMYDYAEQLLFKGDDRVWRLND